MTKFFVVSLLVSSLSFSGCYQASKKITMPQISTNISTPRLPANVTILPLPRLLNNKLSINDVQFSRGVYGYQIYASVYNISNETLVIYSEPYWSGKHAASIFLEYSQKQLHRLAPGESIEFSHEAPNSRANRVKLKFGFIDRGFDGRGLPEK